MKNFRNLLCVAVMLIVTANVFAQKASELVYTDVAKLIKNGTVQILGKGFDNGADSLLYARLPADMQGKIRKAVIDLGRNSAGIAIRFSTNICWHAIQAKLYAASVRGAVCARRPIM